MDTLSSGQGGGLAQVVERSIRIREAPGSIPGFSTQFWFYLRIRQHYVGEGNQLMSNSIRFGFE